MTIGEDTLDIYRGPSQADRLAYPRTVLFDREGFLFISDGQNGGIWRTSAPVDSLGWTQADAAATRAGRSVVSPGDRLVLYSDSAGLSAPYLAGFAGDTLVVFNAGNNDIALLHEGSIISQFPLRESDAKSTLRYVGLDGRRVAVKALDDKAGSVLAWYDLSGDRLEERRLDGPYWRFSGLIKSDGDSLLSLRGYLPSIDIYFGSAAVDSVGLYGFDSPMLARTRSFEYKAVKAPPLLVSSTAACGNRWYVLNVRPGWIRIDEYDRNGQLHNAYTQPNPTFDRELLTTDLAVWCPGDGRTILAVSVASPMPEIRWFSKPTDGN